MTGNKNYNINIYGLKRGAHSFDFEFNDALFSIDEFSMVEKGRGVCKVELERTETFITMIFKIEGSVGLVCDRSLEPFDFPINLENKLILKYGEEFDDSDDEMWIIPDTTQIFNVERNIFEFINVAIPMKRLHPDLEEDDSDEITLVYSSEEAEEPLEQKDEIVDPRWAALKNLKK